MKKMWILALVAVVVLTGCNMGGEQGERLILNQRDMETGVRGWTVYTNPAFRYELRLPTNWLWSGTGEDGKVAAFYPKSEYSRFADKSLEFGGAVVIKGHSNWQEPQSLEEFYASQAVNLWTADKEAVKLGEYGGWLVKSVKGRVAANPEQTVEVMFFEVEERIVEVELREITPETKLIVSSLRFYPNNSLGDLIIDN